MTTSTAPIQSRTDTINRIAGQADALGALLSVIQFTPSDARPSVLLTCASFAEEITLDLVALIGGEA